jgi:hypothetical protein
MFLSAMTMAFRYISLGIFLIVQFNEHFFSMSIFLGQNSVSIVRLLSSVMGLGPAHVTISYMYSTQLT